MDSKIAALLLLVLGPLVIYKIGHPSTTLAADGTDPDWDSAVHSRDMTKPTVVFFTAAWCPYCQELEHGVLEQPEVRSYLCHHYNFYTEEYTTAGGRARARKFAIHAFPTLVRYDADGHETGRINNTTEDRLMAWLKQGE